METTVDEQLIERYIRHPEWLSKAERATAETLLIRSPAARAIADFFQSFYEAFEAAGAATSSADEAFLDRLFPPARVIPLHPYRTTEGPTVLAARTPRSAARFVTLATLASEADHVLVRLVWDHERRQGQLYVMASEPEQGAHTVIIFPDLGLHFVTDEKGRVAFPLTDEQVNAAWATARATLHRPLAACMLTKNHLETGRISSTFVDRILHLRVQTPAEEIPPAYAVLEMHEQKVLVPLRAGTGQITLETLPERFMARLYP